MSAVRVVSFVFGVVFLAAGIAGYMPYFVHDGNLFGYFAVDSMHNVVHLVTGAFALWVAMKEEFANLYFKVFGIIYGVAAVAGFIFGHVFTMPVNTADNVLHLVIAVIALYMGYFFGKSEEEE